MKENRGGRKEGTGSAFVICDGGIGDGGRFRGKCRVKGYGREKGRGGKEGVGAARTGGFITIGRGKSAAGTGSKSRGRKSRRRKERRKN